MTESKAHPSRSKFAVHCDSVLEIRQCLSKTLASASLNKRFADPIVAQNIEMLLWLRLSEALDSVFRRKRPQNGMNKAIPFPRHGYNESRYLRFIAKNLAKHKDMLCQISFAKRLLLPHAIRELVFGDDRAVRFDENFQDLAELFGQWLRLPRRQQYPAARVEYKCAELVGHHSLATMLGRPYPPYEIKSYQLTLLCHFSVTRDSLVWLWSQYCTYILKGGNVLPRSLLLLPRVFLGVIFAVAVRGKLLSPVPFKTVLAGFLSQVLPNAHPLYQSFVRTAVLPNVGVVALMVMIGELYVAIAMIFGITTRLAALVAICLLTNYMLAKGMNVWTPASNDAADIVLSIVVGVGTAGRIWGADRWLAARFPHVWIW